MCLSRLALSAVLLVGVLGTGCSNDGGSTGSSSPPPDISGAWNHTEEIDVAGGITCTDTAAVTVNQTGSTFSGNLVQTGTCQTPGGPVDNGGTLTIVGGTISGTTINFGEPGAGGVVCSYRGTLYHAPPDSVAGTLACSGAGITATGTWRMLR